MPRFSRTVASCPTINATRCGKSTNCVIAHVWRHATMVVMLKSWVISVVLGWCRLGRPQRSPGGESLRSRTTNDVFATDRTNPRRLPGIRGKTAHHRAGIVLPIVDGNETATTVLKRVVLRRAVAMRDRKRPRKEM